MYGLGNNSQEGGTLKTIFGILIVHDILYDHISYIGIPINMLMLTALTRDIVIFPLLVNHKI